MVAPKAAQSGSPFLGLSTIPGTSKCDCGTTWAKIAMINACPWFDRVDTKSNPVDGLSRGDLSGNWDLVPLDFPGAELSAAYRRARKYSPS